MNPVKAIFLIYLCALHIIISVVLVFTGKTSRAERLVFLPLALTLPVFGALLIFISRLKSGEKRETPVTDLYRRVGDELSPLASAAGKELPSVAPFEEIMLINDGAARREAMMYILRREPVKYLDMLKTARLNADTEIVHYATATIMEVQRDFELALQREQAAYLSNPDNIEYIDGYIGVLSAYIETGLLQGNTLGNLRRQLSDALEHKLAVAPDSRSACHMLVDNEINLRRYNNASRVAEQMRDKWPSDEMSWIRSLRACMGAGDPAEKARITAMLRNADINWTRAGREEIRFLCGARVLKQVEPYQSQDVQYVAK